MKSTTSLFALAFGALPALAGAADYLGMLKAPQSGLVPSGLYSFANIPARTGTAAGALGDQPMRLKLGYKYSRYFAVESEFVDGTRPASDFFTSPANLSAFRSATYGVETIATLPVWRFSFYGRMGAYHGDPRNAFGVYSTSLLADSPARSRWRYGLGMRYDITKSLGVRAEMERYSLMGGPSFGNEPETEQISLGVSWRF